MRDILYDCSTLPRRERDQCEKDASLRVMLTFCAWSRGDVKKICLHKIKKEYGMTSRFARFI